MTTQRKSSRLPKFKDEAEAAAFWDTHSPEDFPEEFEDVQVRFSKPLIKRGLTIKLGEDTIAQVKRLGQERGIGPTTLARMWILERLQEKKGWHVVDNKGCLEVHITLERPYSAIKDVFDRVVEAGFGFKSRLVTTKDEPGDHRFEVQQQGLSDAGRGSFLVMVKFFDDQRPRTEVIIENRRPDGFCGGAWRGTARLVAEALCEQLSARGHMTSLDRDSLITELRRHAPV